PASPPSSSPPPPRPAPEHSIPAGTERYDPENRRDAPATAPCRRAASALARSRKYPASIGPERGDCSASRRSPVSAVNPVATHACPRPGTSRTTAEGPTGRPPQRRAAPNGRRSAAGPVPATLRIPWSTASQQSVRACLHRQLPLPSAWPPCLASRRVGLCYHYSDQNSPRHGGQLFYMDRLTRLKNETVCEGHPCRCQYPRPSRFPDHS